MSLYPKVKIKGKTFSVHRLVMEAHLGRPLRADEVVHHVNGDKADYRVENLTVLSHQQHSEHHNQKHPITKNCENCGATYRPHPTKRERAKSCSLACRNAIISRKMRGNRNGAR